MINPAPAVGCLSKGEPKDDAEDDGENTVAMLAGGSPRR